MFSCTSVASIVCVFFFFPVTLSKQGATRGMAQPSHSRNIVDLSSKDFTEHSCPTRSPTRSNFPGSRGLTAQPGTAGCAPLAGDRAPFSPNSAVHTGSGFQAPSLLGSLLGPYSCPQQAKSRREQSPRVWRQSEARSSHDFYFALF